MLRLLVFVADLFLLLPWWAAVGVLVFVAAGLWALGQYVVYRLTRDVTAAVIAQGTPLTDAIVNVHTIEPAETPGEPSLIGFDPDDEDYDPDLDDLESTAGTDYFWVEATIAPHDLEARWDPSILFLVPQDFEPEEDLVICETMAVVHTLEIWSRGTFVPQGDGDVTGPQRVRMLFAVPRGLTQAKFAYHFTHFGSLTLPAPAALAHC
jgi:hypothetical protein